MPDCRRNIPHGKCTYVNDQARRGGENPSPQQNFVRILPRGRRTLRLTFQILTYVEVMNRFDRKVGRPSPQCAEILKMKSSKLKTLTVSLDINGEPLSLEDQVLESVNRGDTLSWHRLPGLQLSGVRAGRGGDFSHCELSGSDFSDSKFRSSDFSNAVLVGANFNGADLRGASFVGAILIGSDLGGANLQGADLSGADFSGSLLENSDFRGAVLTGAKLVGVSGRAASFREAQLQQANLSGSDLRKVDFRHCSADRIQLAGSDLGKARMDGGSFQDAHFQGACLLQAEVTKCDFSRSSFSGAQLSRMRGKKVILTDCCLDGCGCDDMNLQEAEFGQVSLYNCNPDIRFS